jgi:hypothetical protein
VPPGVRAFSTHERSSAGIVFGALAGISLVESTVAHVLLLRWSPVAAWVITALSVYSALWMAAIARSFSLRPLLVGNGELVVRSGMLLTLRVPFAQVEAVQLAGGDGADFSLPPLTDTNVVVEFSEPVTAYGIYGKKRRVKSLALSLDDAGGFEQEIGNSRL